MNNASAAELVNGVGGLITLPDVFIRINRLIEDPESTLDDIVRVASQDPSFTVRLLQVANSPFYGFSSSVETVARAVTLIGTGQVRNLALSTSVAKTFAGLPNALVSMDNFWQHSLYCALAARILAGRAGRMEPEAMFTAGMLHDIGELVIFNRLPEKAKEALERVLDSGDEMPVHRAEREVMGLDHAQVGGELARQWNLPPLLQECTAFHHDIGSAQHYPRETAVVHIANNLALMAEVDTLDPNDVPPFGERAWEIAGLSAEEVSEPVIREAQAEIAEARKAFLGD